MAAVIAPARSEARKAAALATSSKVGSRFSKVPAFAACASMASTVIPARSATERNTSPLWDPLATASGIACGRMQLTRILRA